MRTLQGLEVRDLRRTRDKLWKRLNDKKNSTPYAIAFLNARLKEIQDKLDELEIGLIQKSRRYIWESKSKQSKK